MSVTPRLVCACCSRPWDPRGIDCAACGARYAVDLSPPAARATRPNAPAVAPPRRKASPVNVETLEGARDLRPLHFEAELSTALGGVVPGMTVLLWGTAGSGKSTLAAQLGAAMARAMHGACFWLDMEQLNRGLIKACFTRTGSPTDRVRIISTRSPRDPDYTPATWRDALSIIRASPRSVVVIDSLQTWATGGHRDETALMKAAQALGPTVLVISHANKRGQALGRSTNLHSGDANVTISATEITVTKCRWVACPRVFPRASVSAGDTRL